MWHRIKKLGQSIKYAFTRTARDPVVPPMRIRWYSTASAQWSKWRDLPQDWMSSDPTLPLKMSKGQAFQIHAAEVPIGTQSRRKRHNPDDPDQ